MQEGGKSAGGPEGEQEETKEREGDRAAQPDEEQTRVGGPGEEEGAARGNCKVAVLEVVGSDIREGGPSGGVQQNRGSHPQIQRQHRQIVAGDRADARRHHQKHGASSQHERVPRESISMIICPLFHMVVVLMLL